MNGSPMTKVIIIIVLVVGLGMLGFIFLKNAASPSSSASPSDAIPSIPVKDFAPSLPASQKTTIIIQSSDSSEEKYIVPTNQKDTYVKNLPPGYHVVSQTP